MYYLDHPYALHTLYPVPRPQPTRPPPSLLSPPQITYFSLSDFYHLCTYLLSAKKCQMPNAYTYALYTHLIPCHVLNH